MPPEHHASTTSHTTPPEFFLPAFCKMDASEPPPQTTAISPTCKRSILLMSKMARAHAREIPSLFQKACTNFSTHLLKSPEDTGDLNVGFPPAYTKKIAGSIFHVSLTPYVYGSRPLRSSALALFKALLSSTLMQNSQQVCAKLYLKSSNLGLGSHSDEQRALQLVQMGCIMVSMLVPEETGSTDNTDTTTATLAPWQLAVLTQTLENCSQFQKIASSQRLRVFCAHALRHALLSANYLPEVFQLVAASPQTRFSGIQAVLSIDGATFKQSGFALIVKHVLEGTGASCPHTVDSCIPYFNLLTADDMDAMEEGSFGHALSIALKRRQQAITPLLATVLAHLPSFVDLSSACHVLLFDPMLNYWRTQSGMANGDGVDRARDLSIVSFRQLCRRCSDSAVYIEMCEKMATILRGTKLNIVSDRAALCDAMHIMVQCLSTRGSGFVRRVSNVAVGTLRMLLQQENVDRGRRRVWSTIGHWIGHSGNLEEEDTNFILSKLGAKEGALACLRTLCRLCPELLSRFNGSLDEMTKIVETTLNQPTLASVASFEALWLLMKMGSVDSSIVFASSITGALNDPGCFLYRFAFTLGSGSGGGGSSGGVENTNADSKVTMALEVVAMVLRMKERLKIDLTQWKQPVVKVVDSKGNKGSGGKGGKSAKGGKGGKGGGKKTKAPKKIRIAGMKMPTKKVAGGIKKEKGGKTGDDSFSSSTPNIVGHHSHPLLLTMVLALGSGRTLSSRQNTTRTVLGLIQEAPELTMSLMATLRKELRSKQLTVRTNEDHHVKTDQGQLASMYSSVLKSLASSVDLMKSDHIEQVRPTATAA